MANEYINKVVFGGRTLIDLTDDDVTRASVLNGIKFHLPSGLSTTGTCTYTVDATSTDAIASEILNGKKAAVGSSIITGNMPNRGQQIISITSASINPTINNGYHDGSGYATIDSTEQAKLIGSNIKNGVTILGVLGTLTGSEMVSVTTKTVTPTLTDQTFTPPDGYDYFSQFTVNAITATSTDNGAGGVTFTIAGS